jgi:hypothetical protein
LLLRKAEGPSREDGTDAMIRALIGIGLGLALAAGSVEALAQEHSYVGIKKCRSCHKKVLMGNQYETWKESAHSRAFETLKGAEAIEIAKEKGITASPHEAAECLKCHVTAFGVGTERIKYVLEPADGVQCESCHGPGSDYRKMKVMADHQKSLVAGMWEPGKDEKICTTCHNNESPSWDSTKFQLADGTSVAFDFEQAKEKISHPIPSDVKGHYLEREKELRAKKRAAGEEQDDD